MYSPDILYAFIYLINGRLEAYGIDSVLVCFSSLPTTIGAVTRISRCQPGVEDLNRIFFKQEHKSLAAKRARRKRLAHERQDRELSRPTRQVDLVDLTDPEIEQDDDEVRFAPRGQSVEQMPATPATAQAATDCEYADIVNMIKTLNGAIAAISRDTASIQRAYEQLRSENVA